MQPARKINAGGKHKIHANKTSSIGLILFPSLADQGVSGKYINMHVYTYTYVNMYIFVYMYKHYRSLQQLGLHGLIILEDY